MIARARRDVAGAVQLQLLNLGGIPRQRCGQDQLHHSRRGRPKAAFQHGPSDGGHVSLAGGGGGSGEDDREPVLVGLAQEAVGLVDYLVKWLEGLVTRLAVWASGSSELT